MDKPYRKPIKCWLFGHDPVYFTDVRSAGCKRCKAYLRSDDYDLKFPNVFWKNRNRPLVNDSRQACTGCGGYGWDADWSGPYACFRCWGTGRKLPQMEFATLQPGDLDDHL